MATGPAAGMVSGDQGRQSPDAPERDQQAHRSAQNRDQRAFQQQLSKQAPASRTERRADTDLLFSRHGPGKQQVSDVGARDQQDESDRARQKVEQWAGVGGQIDVKGHNRGAPSAVCLGIFLTEPTHEDIDVRLRFSERDVRLGSSDHG